MQRIPEPELMDDPVQAEAYAAADFDATRLADRVLGGVGLRTERERVRSVRAESPLTAFSLAVWSGHSGRPPGPRTVSRPSGRLAM